MTCKLNNWLLGAAIALTGTFAACSDDDFGPTIFDTNDYPLDRSAYTFPLDTFIKKNFLEPYNLKFIYKMEDIGSDKQKNLIPASYENSVKLAVLSKYLWYDVYKMFGGEEFLKQNSPRIIHVIGSASYNPTSGTETLGTAEGGLKITLYKVNNLNENYIDLMNEYFFHVMHHEFGHILDQTSQRPLSFDLISNGHYDPLDWSNKHDSVTAAWGFVTPYASEQAREDWVETLSTYLTSDYKSWDNLLATAYYDWEDLEMKDVAFYFTPGDVTWFLARQGKFLDANGKEITDNETLNNIKKNGGSFFGSNLYYDMDDNVFYARFANKAGVSLDSIGYLSPQRNGDFHIVRKVISRNGDGSAMTDADGKVIYEALSDGGADKINGRQLILDKLQMVREWMMSAFNIDIDAMRDEIQRRQYATNEDGSFKFDDWGRYVNALTSPSASDPSRTVMEVLLDEVNQYKALQTK